MEDLGVIILAAGLGKRMNSGLPKVLHPVGGLPLLVRVLETARSLKPLAIAVVVGHGAEAVRQACGNEEIDWVTQAKQLGTGDAVRCTKTVWSDFSGDLIILSGDVPLVSAESLADLVREHRKENATVTLVTAILEQPTGYGRIVRNEKGELLGIVEQADANDAQKGIQEINAGVYVVSSRFLFAALEELTNRNRQGEYYLPDIVGIALKNGKKVGTVRAPKPGEILGINTREELAVMERALQEKVNRRWMEAGVTLKDPQTTYIDESVTIGRDTVIGPGTHLTGRTVVGQRCRIDGNAYLTDAKVGNQVHLKFSVVLTGCDIGDEAEVGPFAHLRPGAILERKSGIGTFVEVKESVIGEGSKANHLTYIGDARVGEQTNIGAGTITCNYDGFEKYRTEIGRRVQIGSNTALVAPVTVGDDAYVAAGSTVTKNVPSGALALSRIEQKNLAGWVQRFRKRRKKK